jgi:hypothetical protein
MANAKDLISFAMAAVNRQPPLLYGQRTINGLSQRGPDSYDCIGFYRWCVLSIAPSLWPTSWGGEDSWTVPNYWHNVGSRFPIDNGPALPGDAYIWIDYNGIQQHIGIADGKGNVISALNTIQNICVVPAKLVNIPILKVLHTGLEQNVPVMPGTPIGVIRTANDAAIRGSNPSGQFNVAIPLNSDLVVYGEAIATGVIGEAASPVWITHLNGETWVLKRNASAVWLFNDTGYAALAVLQNKINKAIADLS